MLKLYKILLYFAILTVSDLHGPKAKNIGNGHAYKPRRPFPILSYSLLSLSVTSFICVFMSSISAVRRAISRWLFSACSML